MAADGDVQVEMPEELQTLGDVPSEPRPMVADVSIVIPTLGRPILEACLASVLLADSWPARIIVVDQSGSPAIADLLRRVETLGVPCLYVPSAGRQ